MATIIQRKRILIKDFYSDDEMKKFFRYMSMDKTNMYGAVEKSWIAGYETEFEGEHYIAVPRRIDTKLLEDLIDADAGVDKRLIPPIPVRKNVFSCFAKPRDITQQVILDFMMGRNSYEGITTKQHRKALFAQTGSGKTYLTIKFCAENNLLPFINCPDKKAILTWQQEFGKFTDIKPEEIFVIMGKDSVVRLIKNFEKKQYKVILCSSKTMTSLILSKDFELIEELFTHLGIGLLVHDESHLNLMVLFYLEMICNTRHTLFLTATPSRRMYKEDRLLKSLMPPEKAIYVEEAEQRFTYVRGCYFSNMDKKAYAGIALPAGTNLSRYFDQVLNKKENYEFFRDEIFAPVVNYALRKRSRTDKDDFTKLAFLCNSKKENEFFYNMLKDLYKDKYSIGIFNSDIENMDERFKETEKEIIISTDKSFAGIINIPGLEIIINLYPYSSDSHIKQVMGRIRKEKGKKSIFIQMVDASLKRFKSVESRERSAVADICAKVFMKELNTQISVFNSIEED